MLESFRKCTTPPSHTHTHTHTHTPPQESIDENGVADGAGRHASTVLSEQVEEARNFYRVLIKRFKRNGYEKIDNFSPRGGDTTKRSGFHDYLWAVLSLFSIIYGSNLGCRARQDYEKLPTWGFKFVRSNGHRIGIWCLEAFVKKHNTTGKRRCPSFILDLGSNSGVCELLDVILGGRDPKWAYGKVGKGKACKPAVGSRVFLYPQDQCNEKTTYYWKEGGIGEITLTQP